MEKQETEMKWKLEMETGNGNWKRKPETKNKWKRNFFTAENINNDLHNPSKKY